MGISSREILYKFFKKRNSTGHIFSNNMLFCDIEFKENGHERLLTEAEFDLNILLMGQFLFNYHDVGKHRPHDIGMNESHVSFSKGCFRGQEIIARTNYLSKSSKQIFPIFLDFDEFLDPKYKELQRNQVDDGYILLVSEKIN